jgi:hypothetical protein
MELVLNLGWVVLVTLMCWLWLRHPARCEGRGRWAQLASLALVLVMMFVVITMYDDMAMAQNPTETSCFAREELSGARSSLSRWDSALHSSTLLRTFFRGILPWRGEQSSCPGVAAARHGFHSEPPSSCCLIPLSPWQKA